MNLYYQQNRGNKQELQKMIEQIEEDIQLVGIFHLFQDKKLGGISIRDDLAPGVVETIHHCYKAGILTWIITGDKAETAYSIAVWL